MIDRTKTMTRRLTTLAAALLCCAATPALAEDPTHPEVTAKYSLDLGWYFPDRDIDIGSADGHVLSVLRLAAAGGYGFNDAACGRNQMQVGTPSRPSTKSGRSPNLRQNARKKTTICEVVERFRLRPTAALCSLSLRAVIDSLKAPRR